MFSKAFVINLPFKKDRLQTFTSSVPACFGNVQVWPAVHGDTVRHPDWWTAGRGAWGCYRSHLQILEHCYNEGIDSYVVFEDDAIFRSDCEDALENFLRNLPPDWEQIYLGGQLLHEFSHPPQVVNEHVLIPFNVNRTHCYAVHQRGYERLYRHLNNTPFASGEHIDHHLGRLHETKGVHVYIPAKWLIGQNGGPSNISGNTNSPTFWVDPVQVLRSDRMTRTLPCVFLESSMDVAIELERLGWHRGHWKTTDGLDRGVCDAISSLDCRSGFEKWYRTVLPEGIREGAKCLCLYHPSLTWSCVSTFTFAKFIHVQANSVPEAESALEGCLLSSKSN